MLRALLQLWRAGVQCAPAIQAAEAAAEHGPLAALRAFVAATPGQLDDEAVAALEAGIDAVLRGLDLVVEVADGVTGALEHVDVRRLGALAGDAGYAAGRVRAILAAWRSG